MKEEEKNLKKITDIFVECPKTIKQLKEFYLKQDSELEKFLTNDILKITILKSPYSLFNFFDTKGKRATLTYDWESNCFRVTIEGDLIETEEGFLEDADRNKALLLAVIHLFNENEKTL